jgi:penicillin-binding protein 1A
MAQSPAKPAKPAKPVSKQVQPPRKRWLRILKWAGIVALAGMALMAATIAFVFWMYGRDPNLPTVDKLRDILDHPKQVTKVLDMNGDVIGELGTERRTAVKFEQIPTIVVDSFVAAEDNNFWEHGGVDYTGMMRAFFANLRAGHATQGASTITQQVVKNLLLSSERTFKRKIQEVILARRLEHALTKQEIMTLYLNQIDFGHNTYGVQEAARLYFGKDLKDVNVGEAALLAALPKEPEKFYRDLHGGKHPEAAKQRQVYVLDQLVRLGKISQPEAQKWADAPIQIVKSPFGENGSAPEWVTLARKEIVSAKGEQSLDTLGGQVRTTLDPGLQAIAQKSLQAGLRVVDKRHKIGRPIRNIKPDKLEGEIARLARALGGEPKAKQVYEAVVTQVDDKSKELEVDLGHWSAALALGTEADERNNPPDDDGKVKAPSERFKPGDVVAVMVVGGAGEQRTGDEEDVPAPKKADAKRRVVFAPGPEGAVVIMEVKSRKVRALVGGYASKAAGFDRATMAKRQPGSAFKPFVYATAFAQAATRKCHANDSGEKQLCATPASIVNDAPETYKQWVPKNFESGEYLGAVRLRTALAKSINTVSVHIALDVGPENIVGIAHKMGIQSNLPAEVAVALGADEVTPLELTNAYATFAAGGLFAPPRFIDAIDGNATPDAPGEQAVPPELAYVVTDLMRSVTIEGTAADVGSKLKITIAGKTGTSNEARNTWFVGMTPDYVIGVWVGYDDNRPMPGEQGARVAAPIFTDIAKQMHLHEKEFSRPPHVVEAVIDRQTGLLAPDGAPKETTMTEVFIEGTQPIEVAPKPGELTEGSSVTGEYGD